jgi:hypothetical protein
VQLLGNTPSNGAVIGNTSDKSVLSSQIEHNIFILEAVGMVTERGTRQV